MAQYKMNFQGFKIMGMDFDTNYGKDIHACFQFEFNGFLISVSTGAIQPSRGINKPFLQPILVINLATDEEHSIDGSVQDAIDYCIANKVKPQQLVTLSDYATGESIQVDLIDCTAMTQHPYNNSDYSKLYTKLHFSDGSVYGFMETPDQIKALTEK